MIVSRTQSKKIYWFLVMVFLLFSMATGTVGYFFYDHQKRSLRKDKWDNLRAIADLKVEQIVNWRREHSGGGGIIYNSPFIADHVQKFLEDPKAAREKREIIELMVNLQRHYKYLSTLLLDPEGNIRLSISEEKEVIGPHTKKLIMEALQKKEVIFFDFHRSDVTHAIFLSLIVPISVSYEGETIPIGVFLLRIDPYPFLYQLIQSWPGSTQSAESILVRREGEEVLFLNELRHQKDTALNLRLPLSDKRHPEVIVVLGQEGVVEGIDYQGVPVLAALRKIPDSPWYLIAKVDQEEIYAPIRLRTGLIMSLVGVLIFGAALSVVLLWRGQRLQFQKEQYEAELKARALTEHLYYLNRYANDIILLMDKDLRIIEANERAVEFYGYTREELLQLSLKDLRAPETRSVLDDQIKNVKEQNGFRFEVFHQHKDGTRFPVENSSRMIELDGKSFYQSIIRDITERKRAEEALRESEERFRITFEQAAVGIAHVAPDGRFLKINQRFCDIVGYTQEEMLARTFQDITYPDDLEDDLSYVNQLLKGIIPNYSMEKRYIRKDGSLVWVILTVAIVREITGEPKYFIPVVEDITERKKAEQEMANLQEQLRQSQKMEAIGRLAGGIAHDFNNLLTVIKGYSQLSLLGFKEGDPLRGNLEEIKNAADRAADLTRQLLAFSRRQVLEMKVLDLNAVLKNLDKMLHRVIGEDVELVNLLAEDLGRVKVDPGQIEQVIMNLAVNAKDAMSNGGKLTIETANVELDQEYANSHIAVKPGRYVMVSVSDTGIGMSQEVKERVFEPFFTTKEKNKGTGLGLSTVYGIVKQSGGNIWIYSEPGKGTTFKIYLPRVDEPLEKKKEKVMEESFLRGDETVLVVEDDEVVRKLAVQVLRERGYTVLEAPQGLDAFLICAEHDGPIHLLLTDVVMPKMSGRELAETLISLRPGIKVLYMSGYTDNAIVHHGILIEGVNYIQKPFTVEGLARKVREVLDK